MLILPQVAPFADYHLIGSSVPFPNQSSTRFIFVYRPATGGIRTLYHLVSKRSGVLFTISGLQSPGQITGQEYSAGSVGWIKPYYLFVE